MYTSASIRTQLFDWVNTGAHFHIQEVSTVVPYSTEEIGTEEFLVAKLVNFSPGTLDHNVQGIYRPSAKQETQATKTIICQELNKEH